MPVGMNMMIKWSSPPETPELEGNAIHVWRAALAIDPADLQRLECTLTDDERVRAERFVLKRDRDRFIAARGILRELLARYLQCVPQAIDFVYGPHGKPAISHCGSRHPLSFNLSHSHGLALIGLGREREVGIDVELIRPEFAGEEIARRYFSAREIEELGRLSADLRPEGFFLCWTRKEAYIKAKGDGLHISLDSFDVFLSPGRPAILSVADESHWSIESFVPSLVSEPRYVAAIVAEGKDFTPSYFEWKLEAMKQ